jgi:PST family polysaccharide transporter/lipopolysaccharide exporter
MWRGLGLSIEKVIFLLRILVLARILAPADFGLVAIGMVSLAVMVSLTDFGIVPALIQQPADNKRHLDTAWTIGLVRGVGINIIMIIAAPFIAYAFDEPDATNIIRLLAVTTLLQAGASIEVATLTRELKFKQLALIRLSAAVCNTIVSILLAGTLGAWAIVWGAVGGAITHLVVSYIVAPYRPRFRMESVASSSLMRFGRWIFAIGVTSVAADAALRWIITNRLGVAELGLYFMAARLAYLPYQVITELVGEVAFPMYAQLQENRAKATRAFRTVFVSMLALLLPTSLIMIVLIPDLVTVVLGEQWSGATTVMQLLVAVCVAGVAGDSIIPLLKGMGSPRKVAALDLLQLLVIVPAAWYLVGHYGLAGAGLAALLAVVFSQFFAIGYVREVLDRPFGGTGGSCLAIVAASLAGSSVSLLIANLLSGLTALLVAAIIGAVTAIATGLILDYAFKLNFLSRMVEPFPVLARLSPGARQDQGTN